MFKEIAEGIVLALHILPNAGKSEIVGEYNGALKLKIQAPPVDGKANDAIVEFFARRFKIPKSQLEILRGDKSKRKSLLIRGLTLAEIQNALA